MEAHVLASTKEKALSARVGKGSKEKTAKVKTKNTTITITAHDRLR